MIPSDYLKIGNKVKVLTSERGWVKMRIVSIGKLITVEDSIGKVTWGKQSFMNNCEIDLDFKDYYNQIDETNK